MSVLIRLVERRDAAEIRAIHNHYVTESTSLFDMVPRTLDDQIRWIDEHSGGHPAVVAVARGTTPHRLRAPFREPYTHRTPIREASPYPLGETS